MFSSETKDESQNDTSKKILTLTIRNLDDGKTRMIRLEDFEGKTLKDLLQPHKKYLLNGRDIGENKIDEALLNSMSLNNTIFELNE